MRLLALLALVACEQTASTDKEAVHPGVDDESDADGDGFSVEEGDCDDADSGVSPTGEEVCNGIDDNCDGEVDEEVTTTAWLDTDGDGFGDPETESEVCEVPAGSVQNGGDCDDSNSAISPSAEEICNGVDDDCDGDIDDGLMTTWYADADEDGYGDAAAARESCDAIVGFVENDGDCDDSRADANPDSIEVCDDIDNDCNGAVDDGVTIDFFIDVDGDGHGTTDSVEPACSQPFGYSALSDDCDDTSADVSPDAIEVCNGVDDDCDGTTDEPDAADASTWYADADGDGYGDPAVATTTCDPSASDVANAEDCDDTDPELNPATIWYLDADGDGYGSPDLTLSQCEQPVGYVSDSSDCDNLDAAVNPAAIEVCDGIDNDCDGFVDDADSAVLDPSTWYADSDGDGYGDSASSTDACEAPTGYVLDSTDCDDASSGVNPAASEACNGIDDDCDGLVDDDDSSVIDPTIWHEDYDSDGFGNDAVATTLCDAPAGYVSDNTDCDDDNPTINPAAVEVCDHMDNECDGLVDDADSFVLDPSTWYADGDGDNYGNAAIATDLCEAPADYVADNTDCDDTNASVYPGAPEAWYDGVDSDCDGLDDPDVCDELPGETSVSVDASCTDTFGTSWSVSTEWPTDSTTFTYATGSAYTEIMAAPVVGNLTDDNADGLIDELDTPEVVYTTFTGSSYSGTGYLRVISGDDGSEVLSIRSMTVGSTTYTVAGAAGVAIGDLEGDGSPDILTMSSAGDVLAFEADGTKKWVYDTSKSTYQSPYIADMDGDGDAEVIVGNTILSSTGVLLGTCTAFSDGYFAFTADVDADGTLEVVGGDGVCEMNGATVWSSTRTTGWPGVGNFDSDPELELVNMDTTNSRLDLIDDDGTFLWSYANGSSNGGPPVVGDFDGDGSLEIGISGASTFTVVSATGTKEWQVTIDDSSSKQTSATAFDFDADGALEIVYADEGDLYGFDGASGATVYTNASHASGTIREHPVVADVDRDGEAEIILASNDYAFSGWDGIHVLGTGMGEWPSAGLHFNQHAFTLDTWDNALQAEAPGSDWDDWRRFRGQRGFATDPEAVANLTPLLLGVCEDCDAATAEVYVSLENTGAVFAPAGVIVSLYAVSGSTSTLLSSQPLGESVEPGVRTAPITFSIATGSIGTDGLSVAVDAGGTVHECDTTDNTDEWDASSCP